MESCCLANSKCSDAEYGAIAQRMILVTNPMLIDHVRRSEEQHSEVESCDCNDTLYFVIGLRNVLAR